MTAVANKASLALAKDMHRLWTDHAVWTRDVVIAVLDSRHDAEEAAARLLRNQQDIGRAFGKHYSRRAANRLRALLKQHVMTLVDLLEAARNVDRPRFTKVNSDWSDNAKEIASLLTATNPVWEPDTLSGLLQMHLSLVTAQITARLEENFDADVEAFDQDLTALLTLADTLTDGIVRDFADKFAA
jgi:hypothetical protein